MRASAPTTVKDEAINEGNAMQLTKFIPSYGALSCKGRPQMLELCPLWARKFCGLSSNFQTTEWLVENLLPCLAQRLTKAR